MTDEFVPPIIIPEKSPDFKTIFVDGMYTWLQSESGTILFFYDIVDETKINDKGGMTISTTKRMYPFEVRMRRSMYSAMIQYMTEQLKAVEKIEKKS